MFFVFVCPFPSHLSLCLTGANELTLPLSLRTKGIQAWIALAARHENSLYFFFHECASISKPFFDVSCAVGRSVSHFRGQRLTTADLRCDLVISFQWAQLGCDYMALSTVDPAHPADRSAKNIEVNLEELLQDGRLTETDVKKILAEVDRLATWTKWAKVRYELEMRKNFLLAREDAAPASGLSERDLPSEKMREEVGDIDTLMRELMEAEGVPIDDGVCEDGVRGTEKEVFPWAWFDAVDPLNQHLPAEETAGQLKARPAGIMATPPSMKHVRKLGPIFAEHLGEILPEWQYLDRHGALPAGMAPPPTSTAQAGKAGSIAKGKGIMKMGRPKLPKLGR